MRILFYYYMGGGGGLSNLIVLLRTMAQRHPEDSIEIVTSPSAHFDVLQGISNIRIRPVRVTGVQEIDRLLLGLTLLPRLVRAGNADVLWSLNLGPYVKPGVPSILSVHNPYQVHPWKMSRYHPGSRARVAALRSFFRRSLRVSDAVIVQTPIMGGCIREIAGAPRDICVAPKAVERESDVRPEPLPPSLQRAFETGVGPGLFTFLYVSTCQPHKNHGTLLRAFSELARRNVRARVVLTLTSEEILALGWHGSAFLLESGHVVPAGWVEKVHLRSLYAACDACLMPSTLESLSSAHLEAMQWGRPQIAADLPYARDLCGPAALYASAEEPSAWVQQIERLVDDERIRQELIREGYAQMRRYPASWDDAAETVHQFLVSVARDVQRRSRADTRGLNRSPR